MPDLNPPEHAVAMAAETLLGAPRGLRHVSGGQFGPLYHGTSYNWKTPAAAYNSPLHVDTDMRDFPAERAFGFGGGTPREDWDQMTEGRVKEFKFKPEARVHITDTEHRDGILPDAEEAAVRKGGYDATMFRHRGQSHLGVIYNADAVENTRDLGYKQVTGSTPEEEMDAQHGEDWRDWL